MHKSRLEPKVKVKACSLANGLEPSVGEELGDKFLLIDVAVFGLTRDHVLESIFTATHLSDSQSKGHLTPKRHHHVSLLVQPISSSLSVRDRPITYNSRSTAIRSTISTS